MAEIFLPTLPGDGRSKRSTGCEIPGNLILLAYGTTLFLIAANPRDRCKTGIAGAASAGRLFAAESNSIRVAAGQQEDRTRNGQKIVKSQVM
jgi:hypothetical protein